MATKQSGTVVLPVELICDIFKKLPKGSCQRIIEELIETLVAKNPQDPIVKRIVCDGSLSIYSDFSIAKLSKHFNIKQISDISLLFEMKMNQLVDLPLLHPQLTHLDLSGHQLISTETVNKILTICGHNLNIINLNECHQLKEPDVVLELISRKCRRLRTLRYTMFHSHLKLSPDLRLRNRVQQQFFEIIRHCSHLKLVCICWNRMFDGMNMVQLISELISSDTPQITVQTMQCKLQLQLKQRLLADVKITRRVHQMALVRYFVFNHSDCNNNNNVVEHHR